MSEPPIENAPPDGGAADVLPFGPYRGEPVDAVAVMDPDYLLSLVREGVGPPRLRAAAGRALARRGHLPTAHAHLSGVTAWLSRPIVRRRWAPLVLAAVLVVLLVAVLDRRLSSAQRGAATQPMVSGLSEASPAGGVPTRHVDRAVMPMATVGALPGRTPTPYPGTPPPCGGRIEGAVGPEAAGDFVDTFQPVEFRVVNTKDTGRVTFLNSHDPYQGHFYVAIFPGDYDRYPEPPARHFKGRCIVVQGTIELYRGTPQIVLRDPNDVRFVGD